MKSINIIITDPLRLLREGINALISVDAEIECTGEANDSISLLNILSRQIPDVILIGTNVLHIISTIQHISKNFPKSKIIILSLVKDPYFIFTCKEMGVSAYLHGDVDKEELIFAIRKAAQGQKYFNHEIEVLSKKGFEEKKMLGKIKLSKREKEVILLLTKGYDTKQISEKLILSKRTIESHRLRMLQKFEAQNSVELIKILKERLLID